MSGDKRFFLTMMHHKTEKGFSLLELMAAVSITAILLTVGIPSFQSSMLRARGAALADTLITAVYYARSEAISRNESILLCASTDSITCDAAANDWNSGWIAMDTGNNVIKVWSVDANNSRVRLFDNANAASDQQRLTFNSLGEASLRDLGGLDLRVSSMILTAEVVNCGANQQRNITVGAPGNVVVVRVDC